MMIESEQYKGHLIEIEHDQSPMNPRTEFDNLTDFHCLNGRYNLGEHRHIDSTEINEVVREAKAQGDMVLNLYAYIHSGVALSLESFHGRLPQGHAEFDSGQCGVVIIRRENMLREFSKKRWTKTLRTRAYGIAKSDVETFTAYLNGCVYGYVIDGGEESCWGYYSVEEARAEAKGIVDYMVATAQSATMTS